MQCGFGPDMPSMNLAEMSENPQLRHPLTSNPGGKGGDDHCVLTCKPGSIGQFPVFARLPDGVSARVECLPKKLKPMWKPTKVQVRCYGNFNIKFCPNAIWRTCSFWILNRNSKWLDQDVTCWKLNIENIYKKWFLPNMQLFQHVTSEIFKMYNMWNMKHELCVTWNINNMFF